MGGGDKRNKEIVINPKYRNQFQFEDVVETKGNTTRITPK